MKQTFYDKCSKYVYENIYLHEISPILANILYYFKEGGLMVFLALLRRLTPGLCGLKYQLVIVITRLLGTFHFREL
jgi:hypothetical protein